MRSIVSTLGLLFAAIPAFAQSDQPPARYELEANLEAYPQGKPRETIASVLKAMERNRWDYFLAQLLDPKFIDARISDRAKLLEAAVERDLREKRSEQKRNPEKFTGKERVPDDPKLLGEMVRKEATSRAFKVLVKEIREYVDENPDHLRDLRKIMNEGIFVETGDVATATHKDVKKTVYFKKIDRQWYVEDRTNEPAAKLDAKPESEPK